MAASILYPLYTLCKGDASPIHHVQKNTALFVKTFIFRRPLGSVYFVCAREKSYAANSVPQRLYAYSREASLAMRFLRDPVSVFKAEGL